MTMIARVADGLPLAATIQEDEQVKNSGKFEVIFSISLSVLIFSYYYFQSGRSVLEYQNQAKMLFRKLTSQSPSRCTIETGPFLFQYVYFSSNDETKFTS